MMLIEHMGSLRQADRRSWRDMPLADLFVSSAALIALAFFLSTYAALPGLAVFGHDEVHYYPDFFFKLGEDGRWLNFLLHKFLRSISPGAWACMLLVSSWVLFYRLARSLELNVAYAALVASTVLVAYPFVEQSLWPATTIPAIFILLFTGLFVERGIRYPIIYVLSGILLFGTMQNFYFLLPLFFLRQFITPPRTGEKRWLLMFAHISWWIAGAVAGVLVMSSLLWIKTGHFGVQPAAWRQTHPAHDVAGLLRNIHYVIVTLREQLTQLSQIAGMKRVWFVTALCLALLIRARTLIRIHHALRILIAVIAAFFAFSIPLAPVIQSRSLVAMAVAVIVFIAIVTAYSTSGRMLGALLLLTVSYNFSIHGEAYLAKHKEETTFFFEKLRQLMPRYPTNYSAIALFGTINDNEPEAERFNSAPLMHSVVHALGVQDYRDCRQGLDARCNNLAAGEPIAVQPFAKGQLQFSISQDGIGVIRYRGVGTIRPE